MEEGSVLTRPRVRRALQLLTVMALTVTVSVGCARVPEDPVPPSAAPTIVTPPQVTAAELTAALTAAAAAAEAKPYSAKLDTRSLSNGQLAASSTGRVNLQNPLTGEIEIRTTALDGAEAVAIFQILTADAIYVRPVEEAPDPADPQLGTTIQWQLQPRPDASTGSIPNLFAYARLLLSQGPEVVVAEDPQNGAPATRLSGQITIDQIRSLDPQVAQRMQTDELATFDCDLWIDRQGRVVRMERLFAYQGTEILAALALSEFGELIPVAAPTQ